MTGYSLILAFPDQSDSFVHGFEAGRVWDALTDAADGDVVLIESVHQANAELYLRMGEALGRAVRWTEYGDIWADITFEAVQ